MLLYIVGGAAVLILSGLMAMAGLGAAFLFVPLFYYLGVPLPEATSTALLLNAVSLSMATVSYSRGRLIDWRVGLPVLVAAIILAPFGASFTARVDRHVLLALFAAFLVFAGTMMLFYRAKAGKTAASAATTAGVGVGVGGVAGFLGGLLGVGGGNIVLPGLTALGLETKMAAGTTALVVVFSSLSGFAGHAAIGHLDSGVRGHDGRSRRGRVAGRLPSDADAAQFDATQANHRRSALGDRHQDRSRRHRLTPPPRTHRSPSSLEE